MAENGVPTKDQDGKGTANTLDASIAAIELAGGLRLLSSYVEGNDPAEMDKEGMRCILDLLTQKASDLAERLEDTWASAQGVQEAAHG